MNVTILYGGKSMELKFKEEIQLAQPEQKNDSTAGEWSPWEEEPYQTLEVNNTVSNPEQMTEETRNFIVPAIRMIIILLIIGSIIFVASKAIVSVVMPEGEDITSLLTSNADTVAAKLGVTFQDNPEWVSRIHQYSKGTVTVKAAEDIGIVYIDSKQIGIQVESKAYTMFGIQIGDGEKYAYDHMTYPYDDFLSVLNDMAEGKTTTYFYYNQKRNDCLALTINDTTNRIVGMTYFTDYQKVTETLDIY